jgi:hypothetical protein
MLSSIAKIMRRLAMVGFKRNCGCNGKAGGFGEALRENHWAKLSQAMIPQVRTIILLLGYGFGGNIKPVIR